MANTTVSIDCRKTIEIAGRLSAWLDRNGALATEIKPILGTALERATLDLRCLMRGVDARPCLAIVGGSDQQKYHLAASCLFHPGVSTITELGDLRDQPDDLAVLLEQVAGDELGTSIRFRNTGRRPRSGEAGSFPVNVELLRTADIVKIIVASYYAHTPLSAMPSFEEGILKRTIDRASAELSTALVPGLSPDDVSSLRQYMWTQFADVGRLRMLSTSGYWDWLKEHIARLSFEGRCDMLSYLWHHEPSFTALFKSLATTLRDLGYASSVDMPVTAVAGLTASADDAALHGQSIARQSALHHCASDLRMAPSLAVSVSRGTIRNVAWPQLAALARTVTLTINRAQPFPLENTDLAIFPSSRPSADLSLTVSDNARGSGELGADTVEQLFVRSKARHVFASACAEYELTTLVVLSDAANDPDDGHMRSVAEWAGRACGDDAQARERMENCLALLIKEDRDLDFDRGTYLAEMFGEHNRWASEWTPGRPFGQIYWVPEFANPAAKRLSARDKSSKVASIETAIFPARVPVLAPPIMATSILLEIAANSSKEVRNRQLQRRLATIRRTIQSRIFRYHCSDDPAQLIDWRHQIANVATKRLEVCVEQHQLGKLLSVLMLSEDEIGSLLAGIGGSVADHHEVEEVTTDVACRGSRLPAPAVCAEAIVASWLKLMQEATGSRPLCDQLNIARPVLQHIVDEIGAAVHRCDVVGALARRFVRSQGAGTAQADLAQRYVVVACRELGNFLEKLSIPQSSSKSSNGRARFQLDDPYDRSQPQAESLGAARGQYSVANWPLLFRQMVDANIVAAEGLLIPSDVDYELGEYMSMLTSNSMGYEL